MNGRRWLSMCLAAAALTTGCGVETGEEPNAGQRQEALTLTRGWTEADVTAVLTELRGVDPSTYRVTLPTFTRGVVTGQATYGRLPLSEVEATAVRLNVRLQPGANLVAARTCGGGAGSHTESQSPGTDLTRRLDTILASINQNEFQFLR